MTFRFGYVLRNCEDAGHAVQLNEFGGYIGITDLPGTGSESGRQPFCNAGVAQLLKHARTVLGIDPEVQIRRSAADDIAAFVVEHLQECVIHIYVAPLSAGADRGAQRAGAKRLGKQVLAIASPSSHQDHNGQKEDNVQKGGCCPQVRAQRTGTQGTE
jgi:hypothetical protein